MEPSQIQQIFQALYTGQSGYEIAQREKNRLGWDRAVDHLW